MNQFKRAQMLMLPTNKIGNIGTDNWYLSKQNNL